MQTRIRYHFISAIETLLGQATVVIRCLAALLACLASAFTVAAYSTSATIKTTRARRTEAMLGANTAVLLAVLSLSAVLRWPTHVVSVYSAYDANTAYLYTPSSPVPSVTSLDEPDCGSSSKPPDSWPPWLPWDPPIEHCQHGCCQSRLVSIPPCSLKRRSGWPLRNVSS